MDIETRLLEAGIVLPEISPTLAAYLPAVKSGQLLFISGQLPVKEGILAYQGKVGRELNLEEGQAACKLAAVNCLAVLKKHLNNWADLVQVVKLTGYINCEPDFAAQPQVLNGASQLLESVFGARGRHARAAVGVNALPLGAPCEVEMVVEVR